ncbi:MAG: serine/threonine protein kinase [bacterium]|nr:serine/threonine protein kinase [bacterium]
MRKGDRCGDYTIVGELARGGMGVVYLAHDSAGEERAIKTLIPRSRAKGHDIHERFGREIQLLSYLDHVHVVRFYDAGTLESGDLWVALEYLGGQTLRDITSQRAPVDVRTALRWGRQICKGVHEAHKIGVVHRDLKPANVALIDGDLIKVFDFGIAKFKGWSGVKRTRPGLAMGTVLYMAPEQLTGGGSGAVDARCDVHAIGVILHELLAGAHPLIDAGEKVDPSAMVFRVLARDPVPLTDLIPGFPVDVARIVKKATEKHAADRFQSASALDDALGDALRSRARASAPFLREGEDDRTTRRDMRAGGTRPIPLPRCVYADSVSDMEAIREVVTRWEASNDDTRPLPERAPGKVVPFLSAPRSPMPPPVVSTVHAPRATRVATAVLFALSLGVLGWGLYHTRLATSGVPEPTTGKHSPAGSPVPAPPPRSAPEQSARPASPSPAHPPSARPKKAAPVDSMKRGTIPKPAPPPPPPRIAKPKGPQPIFTRPLEPTPPPPSSTAFIPGAVPDF